jgi:hypothetical protein
MEPAFPALAPTLGQTGHFGTIHQAPMPPWNGNDEAKDYKENPKGFLMDKCQLWLPSVKVFHNWIITATYYLPDYDEVGTSGFKLFRSDKAHDEALWQGKVGLVVAKGPLAFKDEEHIKFLGQDVNVGDWVLYDIMEGRQFTVNRMHCRRLKDTQVVMTVDDPRLIY